MVYDSSRLCKQIYKGAYFMIEKQEEQVKDRECLKCKKFFDCKGKPRGTRCINFEERREQI